jgi:hypothetical protein
MESLSPHPSGQRIINHLAGDAGSIAPVVPSRRYRAGVEAGAETGHFLFHRAGLGGSKHAETPAISGSIGQPPDIFRNRMKIEAGVSNARALLKVQEELGDFDSYCWRFVGGRPKLNRWKTTGQVPTTSPESEAFSKDLKHRGFSFVGPTVMYAYMHAAEW